MVSICSKRLIVLQTTDKGNREEVNIEENYFLWFSTDIGIDIIFLEIVHNNCYDLSWSIYFHRSSIINNKIKRNDIFGFLMIE